MRTGLRHLRTRLLILRRAISETGKPICSPRAKTATPRPARTGLPSPATKSAANCAHIHAKAKISGFPECVAGAGGFEPPYGGIKIRCLTAWRRPIGARTIVCGPDVGNRATARPQRWQSRLTPPPDSPIDPTHHEAERASPYRKLGVRDGAGIVRISAADAYPRPFRGLFYCLQFHHAPHTNRNGRDRCRGR